MTHLSHATPTDTPFSQCSANGDHLPDIFAITSNFGRGIWLSKGVRCVCVCVCGQTSTQNYDILGLVLLLQSWFHCSTVEPLQRVVSWWEEYCPCWICGYQLWLPVRCVYVLVMQLILCNLHTYNELQVDIQCRFLSLKRHVNQMEANNKCPGRRLPSKRSSKFF